MPARIVQVNRSKGGVPKLPLPEAWVSAEGLAGDVQRDRRYHGGPLQALCLFSAEILDTLAREGYAIGPGSLGENLTTRGLDYRQVRVGDVYRAGEGLRFQITKPRAPCTTIQVYGEAIIKRLWGPQVPWGESGFYARVVRPGLARPGDPVELEAQGAESAPATTRMIALAAARYLKPGTDLSAK